MTMPAGRVLQVILIALLLGAVLTADSMVERAKRRDFGWRRDVSVFVWERVADISHVTSLDRPGRMLDDLLGQEHPGSSGSPGNQAGHGPPTSATDAPDDTSGVGPATTEPAAPELRVPTREQPLRTWIGGDSMAQTMGISLSRAMEAAGVFETTLDYRISTGLTRPDYFDWPAQLRTVVEDTDPELMLVVFGANDSQGIEMPDGSVFERNSPDWLAEYRTRVASTMDLLRDPDGDRLVIWIGQPVMRDSGFSERMAYLNNIYFEEAARRPWIRYFDTWAYFADSDGNYAPQLSSADGTVQSMRLGDGIHLTTPGGDRFAWAVMEALGEMIDLSAGDLGAPGSVAPPPEVSEREVVPVP